MPYVGNIPAEKYAAFNVQYFTTSATDTYTLDRAVANELDIRLVINNVIQEPGAGKAYTAAGTTLTLSAATAGSDTMYCVYIGKAVQTVNPGAGSVGTTALADNAVTEAKLNVSNSPTNGYVLSAQSGAAGGLTWAVDAGGAALTGSTNNTITTVTGANAIQGEANLTFDGDNLLLSADYPDFKIQDADAAANSYIQFQQVGGASIIKARSNTNDGDFSLMGGVNSGTYASFGPNIIKFYSQNTEKARMFTGGVTAFSSGIALGVGIADTASNVLDDYEEGTFTPTISVVGATLNAVNSTYGSYTKIGSLVHVDFGAVVVTSSGTPSRYDAGNMPFQSNANAVGSGYEYGQTGTMQVCNIDPNSTTVFMRKYSGGNIASAYLKMSITYQTSA